MSGYNQMLAHCRLALREVRLVAKALHDLTEQAKVIEQLVVDAMDDAMNIQESRPAPAAKEE